LRIFEDETSKIEECRRGKNKDDNFDVTEKVNTASNIIVE
jgi:hypothetical protein